MAISKEEVQYIDNYLKFLGIKYLDIRIEILDHLASEFENTKEPIALDDFLKNKRGFVKNYDKQWQNAKHWAHQKALMSRILGYFYKPSQLLVPTLIALFIWIHIEFLGDSFTKISFVASLIIPQCLHFYIYYRPYGIHKNIQSAKYILSIMSLPSIFLYLSGLVSPIMLENPIVFYTYWFFALIFNIAGLQEVISLKTKIVRTYSELIIN